MPEGLEVWFNNIIMFVLLDPEETRKIANCLLKANCNNSVSVRPWTIAKLDGAAEIMFSGARNNLEEHLSFLCEISCGDVCRREKLFSGGFLLEFIARGVIHGQATRIN